MYDFTHIFNVIFVASWSYWIRDRKVHQLIQIMILKLYFLVLPFAPVHPIYCWSLSKYYWTTSCDIILCFQQILLAARHLYPNLSKLALALEKVCSLIFDTLFVEYNDLLEVTCFHAHVKIFYSPFLICRVNNI